MKIPAPWNDLFNAAANGTATLDDRAELTALLLQNEAALTLFIRFIDVHTTLGFIHARGCQSTVTEKRVPRAGFGVPGAGKTKSAIRNPQFAIGFVAAALIALALTAWFLLLPSSSTPHSALRTPQSNTVATLTDDVNAQFAGAAPRLGEALAPGPIHLAAGKAQIMFDSTAVVDLTGPCEFEMTGPNQGRLIAGAMDAYVPQRARGFTVDLSGGAKIIDLGTSFGAQVTSGGMSIVWVSQGRVEVRRSAGESIALVAGDAVRLTPRDAGILPVRLVNLDFNGPATPTGAGAQVWGAAGDQWNALVVAEAAYGRLAESTYQMDRLRDQAGRDTGVGFHMHQDQRQWRRYFANDRLADPVRSDVVYLTGKVGDTSDVIQWRITGLVPGAEYELALLSQKQGGRSVHPTDFALSGVGGGSGGEPAVLDDAYQAVFGYDTANGPVRADAAGRIEGVLRRRPDQPYAAWAGWQLRGPIPRSPQPHDQDRGRPVPAPSVTPTP